jgi:hypothetical protein
MGTWDGGSQWCNRLPEDRKILEVVGFVLEKDKRVGEGGDEPRVTREETHRQRAGRLFVAR